MVQKMSDSGSCAKPKFEYQHPAIRGYVIINTGGFVSNIPLWWHPRNIMKLRSIRKSHRDFRKKMNRNAESGDWFAVSWMKNGAKGSFRTIPRDRDFLRERGFYA